MSNTLPQMRKPSANQSARAASWFPTVAAGLVSSYAVALHALRSVAEAEPDWVATVNAVTALRAAQREADPWMLDLLTVAIVAGAPATPSCHSIWISPATWRGHLPRSPARSLIVEGND